MPDLSSLTFSCRTNTLCLDVNRVYPGGRCSRKDWVPQEGSCVEGPGPCGDSGPLYHQLPHGEAEDRGAVYQLLESTEEGGFVDPDKTISLWLIYSRSPRNCQNN